MHKITRTYKGKTYTREIPACWDELQQEHLVHFSLMLSLKVSDTELIKSILFKFLKLPPKAFFSITNGEYEDLVECIKFLFEPSETKYCLIPHIRENICLLHGPGPEWNNLQVGEFAFVDSYAQRFQQTHDTADLDILVAALYRPVSMNSTWVHFMRGEDIRCKFYDRVIKRRARNLHIPKHIKKAVYLNYLAFRARLESDNPFLFGGGDSKKPNFGWIAIIYDMAGDKLGTTEEVEVMLLSNALITLKKLDCDRIEMEERMKKIK